MLSIGISPVEFLPAIIKTNSLTELQPYKPADPLVVKHLETVRKCMVTPGTRSEYRDFEIPQGIALADDLVKYNFASLIEDLERPLIVDDGPLDAIETPADRKIRDDFKISLANSNDNLDVEAYRLYQENILRRQNHMAVGIAHDLVEMGIIDREMEGMVELIRSREAAAYAPVTNETAGGRTSTQKKLDFVTEYKEFIVKIMDSIYGIQRPLKVDVGIPVKVDIREETSVESNVGD